MQINCWEICSYDVWYQQLYDICMDSIIISVPVNVVAYLRADSIVLPREVGPELAPVQSPLISDWEEGDGNDQELERPSFPEFSRKLSDALAMLDGSAFVKLNWSAPVDAAWITADKTLKCTTLEDIYLLLKSSDKINKDLNRESRFECGYCIVLKRWHNIHPGNEYRCFVVGNELVGICQRDISTLYRHIAPSKYDIVESITEFFKKKVGGIFPLTDYVFDIVKDRSEIFLLDINPFATSIDALLFSYKELHSMDNDNSQKPEFRFLAEEPGHQPKYYGIPLDAAAGPAGQGEASLLEHVIKGMKKQSLQSSSSSDEDM